MSLLAIRADREHHNGFHADGSDAMSGDYAWSSSGTPFFLRPFVQLRGVPAMRFKGDQAASLEIEARWQFRGRWSAVVFGSTGTTRTENRAQRSAFSASSIDPGVPEVAQLF